MMPYSVQPARMIELTQVVVTLILSLNILRAHTQSPNKMEDKPLVKTIHRFNSTLKMRILTGRKLAEFIRKKILSMMF